MKTQAQIDALFRRRIDAYKRQHQREIENFASIPFGYGMRAYSRLKRVSNKSDEIRSQLEDMVRDYTIDPELLKEAVRTHIISPDSLLGAKQLVSLK